MIMMYIALLLSLCFSSGHSSYAGQCKLAGSSPVVLGRNFTWTCSMCIPAGNTAHLVTFKRDDKSVGTIGSSTSNRSCTATSLDPRYDFRCDAATVFSLIIPANHVTSYENNSIWHCEYFGDANVKSSNVLLKIGVYIRNISLSPNDDPLTLKEGTTKKITCSVNDDAYPSPDIQWYIGDTRIGGAKGTLQLTADRKYNVQMLRCLATNNDKSLNATASLNILHKPIVAAQPSDSLDVSPGEQLTVRCKVLMSNPGQILGYEWSVLGESDIVGNESHFTINRVSLKDNRTLQCRAKNSVGTSEAASVRINVLLVPARPNFIKALCCDEHADVVWVTLTSSFVEQESFVQFTSSTMGKEFSNASSFVMNSTLNEIYSVRVTDLSSETTYTFRVVTVNNYGYVTSNDASCQVNGKLNQGFITSSVAVVSFGGLLALSVTVAVILYLRSRRLHRRGDNENKLPSGSTDRRVQRSCDNYEQLTVL